MTGHAILLASMLAMVPFPAPTRVEPATPMIRMSPALGKLLAGKVADRPVSCIDLSRIRGSTTLRDPDALIYRSVGRTVYVNQPVNGCGFRGDEIIVSRTPSTRLCAGDIISAVDRGSQLPSGSCGLGPFVPYRDAVRPAR